MAKPADPEGRDRPGARDHPHAEPRPIESSEPTDPAGGPDALDLTDAPTERGADLSGFAEFRRSAGPLPAIAAVLVTLVFSLGVLAWVFAR